MLELSPHAVHVALKRFFPAQNDDFDCDYAEELKELNDFGIRTEVQLIALLEKWTPRVMEIDRSPMDEFHTRLYAEEYGAEWVADRFKKDFWFSFPALLRIALELEFGDAYKAYAERRDRI